MKKVDPNIVTWARTRYCEPCVEIFVNGDGLYNHHGAEHSVDNRVCEACGQLRTDEVAS